MRKHRSDIDAMVAKFRVGDYTGYQSYINAIGTKYDTEFANWVQTATVARRATIANNSRGYVASVLVYQPAR